MDNRPLRSPGPGHPRSEGAAATLAARRRRVRAIRGRVAGVSVATLMATSGVVVVQMVTGNDPALAKAHPSHRRASSGSPRAASTPTTVTTSAS
jgi:hypothetical protein